jgi:signal transduction histidine kinase
VIGGGGPRPELLERTLLALADVREPHAVVGAVALLLERETGCRCAPLFPDDPRVRAATAGMRSPGVVRDAAGVLVALLVDGEVRAVFALAGAAELSEADALNLRLMAAQASLVLSNALAFDQLRQHAAEGAALAEAARTVLGFTELQPLANALCSLARRFFNAERSVLYGRAGDELRAIGSAGLSGSPTMVARLPLERDAIEAAFAVGGAEPREFAHAALRLPGHDVAERSGLLAVMRAAPFGKGDQRLLDSLVTLAALAIRNVELYEQSARANRALAESNAFKDDLMAMFAHDFKGPLTVISGYAELLLEDGLESELRAAAETILSQSGRLAKLSEDALALASSHSAGFSLSRTRADLGQFVAEAVRDADAGSGRVHLDLPAVPLELPFDPSRLRHALENLLGNALKYSEGTIEVRVLAEDGEARVEIRDHGIGIPAAEIERIFTRFGRASNARRERFAGTGIGLYIARKIIDVHGGRLTVTSQEGEGSTFTIGLPLD